MKRTFRLLIQYDGRPYSGWQRQENARTVQGEIESILADIWGERVVLHGSGRTDAGVHARGQVASFHAEDRLSRADLLRALNARLDREIRVREVRHAAEGFHAQYSAVEKTYHYLLQSSSIRSPFLPFYVAWTPYSLNVERMLAVKHEFIGHRDFGAMMASGSSVKTTERTVTRFDVREHNGLFSFKISANGFLRNMVRNIVGLLYDVGRGKYDPEDVSGILSSGDRNKAGVTAPAEGLTLIKVRY